ncbi:nicotinamide riboside transporter PnuC [Ferruginibacter sp. SUN106]|uniref:nicotinamide riboside transporter PnuC n=1 Tax=Ferruginibacter sp. SUN106 TaxID=2978348 RepID=UPI003D361C1D
MKLLSTVLLLIIFHCSFANTYYISSKGSDQNGSGTLGSPWHSLYKATASVTTPGDIIHVMAGTYNEAVRCNLAVGVSIEGDGPLSVIQSTLSIEFAAIIVATSKEGTDGNQHISNIKIDGTNRTGSWAIEIRGRKNVSIHDCIIADFDDRGVVWAGREDNEEGAPEIYATGNSFYNNTLTNCAKYDGYGRGCFNIGGQEGMLIYNNTITQKGRLIGTNGWPIKYYNGGFLKACKIYNNIITKEAYDGISWDFAIELFNVFGLEIYNNTIIGAIDINHQTKDSYAYSVYIHDNIIGPPSLQSRLETGITLEYETDGAIIENNHLRNLGMPVYFTPREGSIVSNVTIKNNLCDNIGVTDESHHGYAINFISSGKSYFISNFFVYGNKFIANANAAPYYGIGIAGAAYATNIKIHDNTIKGFTVAGILANPAFVIDTMLIENNLLSGNGNGNNPFYIRGVPNNYVFKNNTKSKSDGGVSPGFNFTQRIVRPFYYELKNTGMLEIIAVLSGLLALLFASKENVYAYPAFLVNRTVFLFLGFDEELVGEICVDLLFIALCIYGWKIWLKRDRKKHRIVRVTSSDKKDWLLQLVFFMISLVGISLSFIYFKKEFTTGASAWIDAFAVATALTAMLLIARKKTEAWYWWIATNIVLMILFFTRNYFLMTIYHFALLAMCVWGLRKWNKRKNAKRRSSNKVIANKQN